MKIIKVNHSPLTIPFVSHSVCAQLLYSLGLSACAHWCAQHCVCRGQRTTSALGSHLPPWWGRGLFVVDEKALIKYRPRGWTLARSVPAFPENGDGPHLVEA